MISANQIGTTSGDSDYEGCVVQMLMTMVGKDVSHLDRIVSYLKDKFPDCASGIEGGGSQELSLLRNPIKGDSLTVSYSIEGRVGQGGNGHVYKIREDERVFAAKVLDVSLKDDVEKIKRFRYEIDGLRKIFHPNVIEVAGSGTTSAGMPFYIMPFAEMSLRSYMRTNPSIEARERVARELLAGLKELHTHGIVHRDVKPENILILDGRAVIADIGIAHFNDIDTVLTQRGERLANFAYAAPEQRRKDPKPARTMDIYSCAVVIHELFTGELLQGRGGIPIASVAPGFGNWDRAIAEGPGWFFENFDCQMANKVFILRDYSCRAK